MQKKEEVKILIERALIKPKSITQLKHELKKDEKIIRNYLKEMSDKVTFKTEITSFGQSKIYSLKNDIKEVITNELNKQFESRIVTDDERLQQHIQQTRQMYLNDDELAILNWKEEEEW